MMGTLGKIEPLYAYIKQLMKERTKEIQVYSPYVRECFKEALRANNFVVVLKLKKRFQFILDLYADDISQAVIFSIRNSPFHLEVKLELM